MSLFTYLLTFGIQKCEGELSLPVSADNTKTAIISITCNLQFLAAASWNCMFIANIRHELVWLNSAAIGKSPGPRPMRILPLSAANFCLQLFVEILRTLFLESDPHRPVSEPLRSGEASVPFDTVWHAIGSPEISVGSPPDKVIVEMPSREEVILWLGKYYIQNRNNTSAVFTARLREAVCTPADEGDTPDWTEFIQRFSALLEQPESELAKSVLGLLRKLILLDSSLYVVVSRWLEIESEAALNRQPGDARIWSTLASLTVTRVDLLDYMQEWCRMLDGCYKSPPGTVFGQLNDYLQQLLAAR